MELQKNQSSEVKISISRQRGIVILQASGTLVYQTTKAAKDQLLQLDTDQAGYILDMRDITKIDSTGFGIILNIIKRIPRESRLVVVITDPFIEELFHITKIDKLTQIFDRVETAVDSLTKSGE